MGNEYCGIWPISLQIGTKCPRRRLDADRLLAAKTKFTLYILHGNNDNAALKKLGKHKTSGGIGGCLYINKLSDVDQTILTKLIKESFEYMKKKTS